MGKAGLKSNQVLCHAQNFRPSFLPIAARGFADSSRLAAFAEIHVFAVWDFMALLHSVRLGICPGETLWQPPAHPKSSRLLHEILLEEESGISIHGEPLSHFESYLLAMRGMGASPQRVLGFLADLRDGAPALEALANHASAPARAFAEATLAVTQSDLAERIAVLSRPAY